MQDNHNSLSSSQDIVDNDYLDIDDQEGNNSVIINSDNKEDNNEVNGHNDDRKELGKGRNSNSNQTKTVFTHITEGIYQSLIKTPDKRNLFNFEDLMNDQFIKQFSLKNNVKKSNKKIIEDFLSRSDQAIEKKKRRIELHDFSLSKEKEKVINEGNKLKRIAIKKRPIKAFLNDQKEHLEKRQLRFDRIKQKEEEIHNMIMRQKPEINSRSIDLSANKRKRQPMMLNQINDIHSRLYQQGKVLIIKKNYREKSYIRSLSPCSIKMTSKQIDDLTNKLSNIRLKSNKDSKDNKKIIEKTSLEPFEEILLKKITTLYQATIVSIFNENQNFKQIQINNEQFKQVLIKMGFIDNKSITDTSLIAEAWNIIINHNEHNSIILPNCQMVFDFLLCIFGLYIPSNISTVFNLQYIKSKFTTLYLNYMNHQSLLNNQKKQEMLLSKYKNNDLTFSPVIKTSFISNKESLVQQNNKNKGQCRLFDLSKVLNKKHQNQIKKHLEDDKQAELSLCTFKPKINRYSLSPQPQGTKMKFEERLYLQAQRQHNQLIVQAKEALKKSDQDEIKQCSFSPKIIKVKKTMFISDPLKNDLKVQIHNERYHSAWNEKEYKGYYLENGWSSMTSEEILNKKSVNSKDNHAFLFDNEMKSNKETFDKYKIYNQKAKKVLLSFDIQINEQKRILNYCKDDDIDSFVDEFCKENDLKEEIRKQILIIIKQKINNIIKQ